MQRLLYLRVGAAQRLDPGLGRGQPRLQHGQLLLDGRNLLLGRSALFAQDAQSLLFALELKGRGPQLLEFLGVGGQHATDSVELLLLLGHLSRLDRAGAREVAPTTGGKRGPVAQALQFGFVDDNCLRVQRPFALLPLAGNEQAVFASFVRNPMQRVLARPGARHRDPEQQADATDPSDQGPRP